jgi:diaminohydroxyphosphoribosylaminopyrimidine deaminase/5-amino-6-(5-phosphoribosylamino)uracil reductase
MNENNINIHNTYMQRCIELAELGRGYVAPNPMVGSVIVFDGKIIGEGFHQQYGKAHAEVNAINSVKDESLLAKSTIYVSLEPCAHFGKTPPCSDLIIASKIPKVVIGCVDTFSEVSGKGIEKLKDAGIKVITDILKDECRDLNKRFFTFHEQKRPFIILKWAESLDGYIGKHSITSSKNLSKGIKISNGLSQALVHKWRSEEQAIMVGTNTALYDNPQLNVRLWEGENPVRIVLDKALRLPNDLVIFDNSTATIIFNAVKNENILNTHFIKVDFDKSLIKQVLQHLYDLEIQSVIVEGGAQLLQSFIDAGLWDEARVFKGKTMLESGTKAPIIDGTLIKIEDIDGDKLTTLANTVKHKNL